MGRAYEGLKKLVNTSTSAGLIIPGIFVLAGLGLIYFQIQPTLTGTIKESVGYYNQGTINLVQESYIQNQMQYISNPGADYFKQLTEDAFNAQHVVDTISPTYSGKLYLTIPSLGFNRLPIAANIDSSSEEAYNSVLTNALAHFKGTSLPFSSEKSNIVIYGHSASGNYHPTASDVLAAFSFLPDLKVGDMIILEMNGIEYKYQMVKSKIVLPNDISIITGDGNKETLTLFTCYPPGNRSHRYVAVARPVK
jgi:sortase A